MKIFRALVILVTATVSFAVYNLKAGETNSATPPARKVPGYTFNYVNVPVDAVLKVYADLAGVELVNRQAIPGAPINFSTEKPLTHSEAIKALEKVLREQAGIVLKRTDEKHVTVTYDPSVKVN